MTEPGRKTLEQFDLAAAFAATEAALSSTLGLGKSLTQHGPMVGAGTEHGWFGLLRSLLPGRYGVATGKVVDSQSQQSEQIDLIIYDSFYSPLLFTLGDATFVPAESVYAVFEVKQSLAKDTLDAAGTKATSVRRLHRTSALIPNQFGKELRKDLDNMPILAGLLVSDSEWRSPFDAKLEEHLRAQDRDAAIDIGCALGAAGFDTVRGDHAAARTLESVTLSRSDRSLSFFTMRLLHRLQQLGTVGAIDYGAYTEPLACRVRPGS